MMLDIKQDGIIMSGGKWFANYETSPSGAKVVYHEVSQTRIANKYPCKFETKELAELYMRREMLQHHMDMDGMDYSKTFMKRVDALDISDDVREAIKEINFIIEKKSKLMDQISAIVELKDDILYADQ